MQEYRKAWSNMLLASFCKKFRNLLPESFIIGLKQVSSKLLQVSDFLLRGYNYRFRVILVHPICSEVF